MQHSLHRALRPRFGKAVVGWGLIALSHLTGREGVFHCLIGSPTRVKICSFPLTGPPHGGAAQHGLVLSFGVVPRDVSGNTSLPTAWSVSSNNRVSQTLSLFVETK